MTLSYACLSLRMLLVLGLFFQLQLHSQTIKDQAIAESLIKKGDSLLKRNKFNESVLKFEKALTIFKKNQSWDKVAECYNKISENHRHAVALKSALQNAEKALEICATKIKGNKTQEARAYDNLGTVHRLIGSNLEITRKYNRKALEIRQNSLPDEHQDFAISYFNMGSFENTLGNHDEALKYYQKALNIRKKKPDEEIEIADIYESIGHVLYDKGAYDEALVYFEKSFSIASNFFEKNNFYFVKILNKIGIIYYFKKQFNKSLEYYKKALAVSIYNVGENHADQARLHYNIATIYEFKNEKEKALFHAKKTLQIGIQAFGEGHRDLMYPYSFLGKLQGGEKGIEYLNKALQINLDNFGEYHLQTAYMYEYLAKAYKDLNNYNAALESIQKSLQIRLKIFDQKNPVVTSTYNFMATLYLEKKEYPAALSCIEKAIFSNTKPETSTRSSNTNKIDPYISRKSHLSSMITKAIVLKEVYQKNKNLDQLKKSIKIYQEASELIPAIRNSQTNRDDMKSFATEIKNIYQGSIETQMLLDSVLHQVQPSETIFDFAEKSKANILKELLTFTNAKKFAGLPENMLTLDRDLRKQKASFESKISNEILKTNKDTLKISMLEGKILYISRKQDSLKNILEQEFPKYHELKHQNKTITISDLQNTLNNTTTLVEFFTSSDVVYAIVVTKNKFTVTKLEIPKLKKQVDDFRNTITQKKTKEYKSSAYQLYQEIIAPIESDFIGDELIVIPDGVLWHLNFDLLLTDHTTVNNSSKLPYLLEKYAVTYGNSATLLFGSNKRQLDVKKNIQKECLAFSFSNEDNPSDGNVLSMYALRNTDIDLPGTREEIKEISKIIGGRYFYGSKAIETNFKKNKDQYSVLHLALHGEVDHLNPENSKILFTKVKDSVEDNILYGHELYAMEIPAKLVVLSACNTGIGKIAKGEGILSLGTAFQYAGAQSLLLTSWEVPDKTTPSIMKKFYTNLNKGMNKAKALQQAKLNYIKNADVFTNYPVYWGGFYLIGDNSPIEFESPSKTNWIFYIVLILLSTGVLLYVKREITKKRSSGKA